MNNNLPGDTTFPPGVSLRDIDPETASRKMVSGQPGKPHEFMTWTDATSYSRADLPPGVTRDDIHPDDPASLKRGVIL